MELSPDRQPSVDVVGRASRSCEWCGKPLLVKDTREERNTHTDHPSYRCRECVLARDARFIAATRKQWTRNLRAE